MECESKASQKGLWGRKASGRLSGCLVGADCAAVAEKPPKSLMSVATNGLMLADQQKSRKKAAEKPRESSPLPNLWFFSAPFYTWNIMLANYKDTQEAF